MADATELLFSQLKKKQKNFYKCWDSGDNPVGTPETPICTHNFNKLITNSSSADKNENLPNVRLREKEEKKKKKKKFSCQHNSGPQESYSVHVTQHASYLELG